MDWKTILEILVLIAGAISAVALIVGYYNKGFKWKLAQDKQGEDIAHLKQENSLIIRGLSACLDGLEQLGANHTVPKTRQEIDNYLNEMAHR